MTSPHNGFRYNSPPNWPAPPEGWTPPEGWQADPAWGPAPEGWQFWEQPVEQAPEGPLVMAVPAVEKTGSAWYTNRWAHLVAALVLGIVIGAASTSGSSGGDNSSEATRQAAVAEEARKLADVRATEEAAAEAQASALAEAAAAAAAPPPASAFKLVVKILRKECFGSAGCNVTYRVIPKFVGPGDPANIEVTYAVTGGESGAVVATFTVDSAGTMTYDSENTISTSSSRAVLRAKVTNVERT